MIVVARGACTFRQQDVARALRAATSAGREVQRVEIDRTGKIVLVMVTSENPPIGGISGESPHRSADEVVL